MEKALAGWMNPNASPNTGKNKPAKTIGNRAGRIGKSLPAYGIVNAH
jgi:hypothetical protein